MKLRFSLRLLIVLMGFACALLGASVYRRHSVLKMCAALREDGYPFTTPNELRDLFWQRKPTVAVENEWDGKKVYYVEIPTTGSVLIGEVTKPKEIERLKRLGVVAYPPK
jgi:hypothetical protein